MAVNATKICLRIHSCCPPYFTRVYTFSLCNFFDPAYVEYMVQYVCDTYHCEQSVLTGLELDWINPGLVSLLDFSTNKYVYILYILVL
jgi:hypothetical protein